MFLFYFLGHLTNPPLRTQQLKKETAELLVLMFYSHIALLRSDEALQ